MQLEGRRAIVTGGSRGIGYQISKIFLEEGARVLAVSRDPAKLAAAKEQLPELANSERRCIQRVRCRPHRGVG